MGVLVAVSIPIFTSQLEKARESTDVANERAAKAAAVTMYLSATDTSDTSVTWTTAGDPGAGFTANYDAANGVLTTATPAGYGKGTSTSDAGIDPNNGANAGKYITVTVNGSGEVEIDWAGA